MKIKERILGPKKVSRIKWLEYLFFGSFFMGIILANLLGKEKLEQFGIFNTYYIQQFQYATIQTSDLFAYILETRLPVLGLLFFAGLTSFWYPFQMLFVIWNGGILGFLCVSGIMNLGAGAILLMGTALFPQYIFYVIMYIILIGMMNQLHGSNDIKKTGYGERRRGWFLVIAGLIAVLFLFGMLTETYINPLLVKKVIKIF